MHCKTILLLGTLLVTARQATAQTKEQVKQDVAASTCECIDKKLAARPGSSPLAREEARQLMAQCVLAATGKHMKSIQEAYGTNAFAEGDTMRQLGREVGGIMMQSCPNFTNISLAMASKDDPSTASTTGQTTGQLGQLSGTELTRLEVQVGKTERVTFIWMQRFAQADELLRRWPELKGKQARISWQEVELLKPATRQYQKVREITAIELL